MASLKASSSSAIARSSKNTRNVASNGISSLRVKPFTKLGRSSAAPKQQPVFRLRAAEVDAEAEAAVTVEDNDFEFNMSDAKKNNDYAASDVEAALRFYFEGAAAPASNEDFVTNLFGDEDASFFDDIDNNEAYEADEYIVAGIPEAAPKKRRGGRRGADGEEEADDDDQIAKGKQLDKFKAMEDQMVLEAALEEEFGSEYDRAENAQVVASQGVWDWLTDDAAAEDAGEEFSGKMATVRRSKAELPSDYEVMSGFSTLKVDELDDQTRDMLELIIGDEVSEEELKTMDLKVEGDVPDSVAFTAAEAANLDKIAATPVEVPEVEDMGIAFVAAMNAEESELAKESLDAYLGSLGSAAAAAGDMSADQVKALFSADGEPVDVDTEAEPADDPEVATILAAADRKAPAAADVSLGEADALVISAEEEADYEVKDIKQELYSLAAVEDFAEEDMPDEQQLAILDEYISSAEQFLKAEDDRKSTAQQLVVDGELSADVFAEDLEELPDIERDFAEDFQESLAQEGEDDSMAMLYDDEDDDNEQWVERIIELTRVTKVVKGGKIMGFRCTAIVGNQNGLVGVGCMAGREVAVAAKRALVDAKKNVVRIPLVGAGTIPHKSEAKFHAARCVIVPASDGTGVIAGSSIKSVLELAGVQNVLAKRIGCRSQLNNARATIKALQQLKSLNQVAKARGVPMERLLLPQN